MKKTVIMAVVMFLVVSSMIVLAQEEETADCNFWCKVSRFLFGNPENRAGKGWFERGAVVGKVALSPGLAVINENAQVGQIYAVVYDGTNWVRYSMGRNALIQAGLPPGVTQSQFNDQMQRNLRLPPPPGTIIESNFVLNLESDTDIISPPDSGSEESPAAPPGPLNLYKAQTLAQRFGFNPTADTSQINLIFSEGRNQVVFNADGTVRLVDNDGGRVRNFNSGLEFERTYSPEYTARQLGFEYSRQTEGGHLEEQGVSIYTQGDDFLYFYNDQSHSIVRRDGERILYSIDVSADGKKSVSNFEGLSSLTGDYSDNREIIDELYREGIITDVQYSQAKDEGITFVSQTLASQQEETEDGSQPPAPTPPSPPPPPPPSSGPRDADPNNPHQIKAAVDCQYVNRFEGGACEQYQPMTYGEAYEHLDRRATELESAAKTAALTVTMVQPTFSDLESAPLKSTVTIEGVQYIKIKDKGWVDKDGKKAERFKDSKGKDLGENYVNSKNKKDAEQKKKDAKEARKKADSYRWRGTMFDGIDQLGWYQDLRRYGSAVGDIATAFSQLGSYRALSNALMPDATASWMEVANSEVLQRWADLPNFAAREACGFDDQKRVNTHGSSSVFVRTPGGTVQFVGSLQAERSERKSAVLCELNPDPEGEEEWICSRNEICLDEEFCYKDENADGDPDTDEPEEGFFYKITWGVTAPRDERQTPYVDEDGKAIKFNVVLKGDGEAWLYTREGASLVSAIALSNGESDRDVILHYSPRQFTEACISFDSAHRFTDAGGDAVGDICTSFIISQRGVVEFSGSARSQSSTTASGQVERNRNW